jgi:hypothetical protein
MHREVLEARLEELGARHRESLLAMSNLPGVLTERGKLDEAEPLSQETLEASREVLGSRDPHTFILMYNLRSC